MWRSILPAALVVAVVGCGSKKDEQPVADTTTPPPPAPAPAPKIAPGHVAVKLVCNADGGVDFSLTPWSVESEDGTFTWDNDAESTVDVEITAGKTIGPPFGGVGHGAKKGQPLTVKTVPGTKPGKHYKYMVKATCPPDKQVVIDPDMIIPTRAQAPQ